MTNRSSRRTTDTEPLSVEPEASRQTFGLETEATLNSGLYGG